MSRTTISSTRWNVYPLQPQIQISSGYAAIAPTDQAMVRAAAQREADKPESATSQMRYQLRKFIVASSRKMKMTSNMASGSRSGRFISRHIHTRPAMATASQPTVWTIRNAFGSVKKYCNSRIAIEAGDVA